MGQNVLRGTFVLDCRASKVIILSGFQIRR
jgi:hypothetical protein